MPPMPDQFLPRASSVIPASVERLLDRLARVPDLLVGRGVASEEPVAHAERARAASTTSAPGRRSRNEESSTLPPPTSNVKPLVHRQVVHRSEEPEQRLVVAVDRLQRDAEPMRAFDQLVPVGGVADGRGRDGDHPRRRPPPSPPPRSRGAPRPCARSHRRRVDRSRGARGPAEAAPARPRRTSRCSPSRSRNTIIRPEFEPMSTTAKGRSSGAGSRPRSPPDAPTQGPGTSPDEREGRLATLTPRRCPSASRAVPTA